MKRLRAIKGAKRGRPLKPRRVSKKATTAAKRAVKAKKTASKGTPDRMLDRNFREHQYWMVKRREFWRRQFQNLTS